MQIKKSTRSISGIVPVAVMLKPYPCSNKCIYCPSESNVPKSYTAKSPVVLRAKRNDWNGRKQVESRLKVLRLLGHETDKVELIVMGGTFSNYPKSYTTKFIKDCLDGLNGCISENLEEAKIRNETARHRCVALCLETRPELSREEILYYLTLGCTRVEIGVQTPDDRIYKKIKRGHTVEDVVNSTKLLKDAGFKVGYHMMLGLPGSSPKKDIKIFKTLFSDERFQPDQIKIYPTFVIKGTELEKLYRAGKYEPYSTEQIIEVVSVIKKFIPKYVRIMRIMRDLPANYIVSECVYSHLRDEIKKRKIKCNCIRCREAGYAMREGKSVDWNSAELIKTEYKASGGREIFLSYESDGTLLGLLRLRIQEDGFVEELKDSTIVRELHVYGPQAPLNKKGIIQHRGLGKKLMEEAEQITKEVGFEKISVISGVGVREYYRSLGYKLGRYYMSKLL